MDTFNRIMTKDRVEQFILLGLSDLKFEEKECIISYQKKKDMIQICTPEQMESQFQTWRDSGNSFLQDLKILDIVYKTIDEDIPSKVYLNIIMVDDCFYDPLGFFFGIMFEGYGYLDFRPSLKDIAGKQIIGIKW